MSCDNNHDLDSNDQTCTRMLAHNLCDRAWLPLNTNDGKWLEVHVHVALKMKLFLKYKTTKTIQCLLFVIYEMCLSSLIILFEDWLIDICIWWRKRLLNSALCMRMQGSDWKVYFYYPIMDLTAELCEPLHRPCYKTPITPMHGNVDKNLKKGLLVLPGSHETHQNRGRTSWAPGTSTTVVLKSLNPYPLKWLAGSHVS